LSRPRPRADGFRELYAWLDGRDAVIVKADRKDALVVVPLRLAVAIAAEHGKGGANMTARVLRDPILTEATMTVSACPRRVTYTALLRSLIAVNIAIETRTWPLLFSKRSMRWAVRLAKASGALTNITIAGAAVEERLKSYRQTREDTQDAHMVDQIKEQPMPLPNARQESFAHLVAVGHSATAAYARAYGRERDISSRVSGHRLLTKANIQERIAQIRNEAALTSLPMLQQVIEEAEHRAVKRIRTGTFKQACKATERFADLVIKIASQRPSN
jgi:hypothetical protein